MVELQPKASVIRNTRDARTLLTLLDQSNSQAQLLCGRMAPPPDQGDDEYKDFLRMIAADPKLVDTSETDGAGPAERRVSFATLTSSVLESVLESESTPSQNGSKPVDSSNTMSRRRSSKLSNSSSSEPTNITTHESIGQSHDSPWSRRSSTMSMTGIWDKLQARKSGVWDDMSDIDDDEFDKLDDNSKTVRNKVKQSYRWLKATMHTAITSRRVIVPCLLLFVAWVVTGCLIIFAFTNAATQARKERAVSLAEDTDQFFVRILENAFVPLFTIAQFVYEIDLFTELDLAVGDRCNDTVPTDSCTSAPNMMGELNGTHRNLTDLFNTEYGNATLEKFNNIAAGIKENSGLGKSLAAIQLAPNAVVSLIYPMINCEDFTDGYCLNNTGAWGHDLLNDPARTAIASKTVPADGVVTAGPLPLIQGGETFIARLPINMNLEDGHRMIVDDVEYPCWGFAIVLLDWATLKKDSNIYEEFKSEEMQFILTRTDVDKDTGEEKVVVIAQSDQPELIVSDNVTLALHTGDNGWVISVGYNDGFAPAYGAWVGLVFLSAVVFTLLMMLVLTSKKEHERLLGNLMPLRAINKLRKGETVVERYQMVTIFFSDIVGYTNMSSQMTPIEVMQMLGDLYTQFDVLAKKHNVYKVETIGDAYIAISGAPMKCPGPTAAEQMALFSLEALQLVRDFRKRDDGAGIAIRAGLASGPVVAGVIGTSLPKYTLFGDTVNLASRMESTSKKMQLQVCPSTQRLLLDAPTHDFDFVERQNDDDGEPGIEVKGKGRVITYWVNGAKKLDQKRSRDRQSFTSMANESV